MIELRTLGVLEVLDPGGGQGEARLLSQPKKLALLVYVALAQPSGPIRRDTLLGLLWPELDETHARRALSQALYGIRKELGREVFLSLGQDDLDLDRNAVRCDATAFREALGEGGLSEALDLYGGDFLTGFHLPACHDFDAWAQACREEFRRAAVRAALKLAGAELERGKWVEVTRLVRSAATWAPFDEVVLRAELSLLDRAGNRSGALLLYREFCRRLQEEFDLGPSPETEALVLAIREREQAEPGGTSAEPLGSSAAELAGRLPEVIEAATADPPEQDATDSSEEDGPGEYHRGSPPGVGSVEQPSAGAHARWPNRWVWAGMTLFLGIAGHFAYSTLFGGGVPPSAGTVDTRPSIAVLPFENLSVDDDDGYFAVGLHGELLTRFQQISALKVISMTSVLEYRETDKGVAQIGRELGVRYLLEGGVQRARDRVRINVQLIDTQSESHVWSEIYDRAITAPALFDVQSEIARTVAGELNAEILKEEYRRIIRRATDSQEAYDAYLRFRGVMNDRSLTTRGQLFSAQRFLERAISLDPEFVVAYMWLTNGHGLLYQFGIDQTPSRASQARTESERALELDPDLGFGHLARSIYYYRVEKDFARALEYLDAAETRFPTTRFPSFRSFIQRRMGRWEESLQSAEQARSLDPRNVSNFVDPGATYRVLRRYEEAAALYAEAARLAPPNDRRIRRLQGTLELTAQGDTRLLREVFADVSEVGFDFRNRWRVEFLDRRFSEALSVLELSGVDVRESDDWLAPMSLFAAWTHQASGDTAAAREAFEEARATLERVILERPEDQRVHRALGLAYAGLGMEEEAVRAGRRALKLMSPQRDALLGPPNVFGLAMIHAQLGNADAAVEQLDALLSNPGPESVRTIEMDSRFDPIRDDPGFRALLEKYRRG
jgi:TolB-like protein/DNA-binding SARP family transcriptional activator